MAHQGRILAQGLADIALSMEGGKTNVSTAFKLYVEALFPFTRQQQEEQEKKMREVMKKEVEKGVITFKPVADRFLKQKLKHMELDDEFKRKLSERKARK